jgi:hypothetical protein
MRCLVLFALWLPAQAPGQEVKDWTSESLSKEFTELDRRLKAVEQQFRPADRRMAGIDEQARALRVRVDMLELQIKHLENLLEGTRRELAGLAGRTDALEARPAPPAVKAPAPKGEAVPPSVGIIRSQKVSMGADAITITGEVENKSDKPLVFVVVQADFLDKEGKVVKTGSAYTEPRVIPAGSTGTFVLKAPSDSRIQDHRLALRTE